MHANRQMRSAGKVNATTQAIAEEAAAATRLKRAHANIADAGKTRKSTGKSKAAVDAGTGTIATANELVVTKETPIAAAATAKGKSGKKTATVVESQVEPEAEQPASVAASVANKPDTNSDDEDADNDGEGLLPNDTVSNITTLDSDEEDASIMQALRTAAKAQASGTAIAASSRALLKRSTNKKKNTTRTGPAAATWIDDESAPVAWTAAAPTTASTWGSFGWPFGAPADQAMDPTTADLARRVQARVGNTPQAANRVARAITAGQMVDLVDMLRARPTIVDPLNATAQPFATWTAEGLTFAQPAASSALTQPRTIPDAAALILAVTALAELSRWPAAVSTSHTAVIADLARNEAMGGLRLAALYDLRVRELVARLSAAEVAQNPRDPAKATSTTNGVLGEIIGVRGLPHLHSLNTAQDDARTLTTSPIATVARQAQPAQSPSPHLAQRRAAQSSSTSPSSPRSPTTAEASTTASSFPTAWSHTRHEGRVVCLRFNRGVECTCTHRAHVCAVCGQAHRAKLQHPDV